MTPDKNRNSADFLECVVELIRAHMRHPGQSFGVLLYDMLAHAFPDEGALDALVFRPQAEMAKALREYADKAQVVASHSPSACKHHGDCDSANRMANLWGIPWPHHCADPTCKVDS